MRCGAVFYMIVPYMFMQLLQDLFHKCGKSFQSEKEVRDEIRHFQCLWLQNILPGLRALIGDNLDRMSPIILYRIH